MGSALIYYFMFYPTDPLQIWASLVTRTCRDGSQPEVEGSVVPQDTVGRAREACCWKVHPPCGRHPCRKDQVGMLTFSCFAKLEKKL